MRGKKYLLLWSPSYGRLVKKCITQKITLHPYLNPNSQRVAIATVCFIPQFTGGVVVACRYQDFWRLVERIFEVKILLNKQSSVVR